MSAIIASAAIAAVGAGYSIYHGISQNSAANKLQRGLVRPMYPIQQQYYRNQGLAENQAQQGLTAPALSYYGDQANRGLSAGISGVLQGGGNVNTIGSLYDKYNQGNRAIATQDSQLKNDNIRYLIDRNKDLAGQETQQWAIDKYKPFEDTTAAISALRGSGSQNIANGIGQAGSVASIMAKPSYGSTTASANPRDASGAIDSGTTPGVTAPGQDIVSPGTTFGDQPTPQGMRLLNTNPAATQATQDTMGKYQNSPYYDNLNEYMNQPLSA